MRLRGLAEGDEYILHVNYCGWRVDVAGCIIQSHVFLQYDFDTPPLRRMVMFPPLESGVNLVNVTM